MTRRGDSVGIAPSELTAYPHVEVLDVDFDGLDADERAVLAQVARYCQAMVDADGGALRALIDPRATFTHMSGMRQSRDEFVADVTSGALTYYRIGIERPRIEVQGDAATVSYTSVLTANAYGARGTFRMHVRQRFARRGASWILAGEPAR